MISVLTPTYNRKHTLLRLCDSLYQQSLVDFEWVVIDDGSTDNTFEIFDDVMQSISFPINYFYKSNGGKHTALNKGIELCRGDWILIVDSDDFLTSEALSVISEKVLGLSDQVVGICFRKSNLDGDVIGIPFIDEVVSMSPTDAGHYYQGDLAYIFRRSVMLQCPFPSYEGEYFVPELCIWNKIADLGVILFFSGISFYRCEYLPDGYSANFKSNLRRNPKGFAYHYWDAIKRESGLRYKLKALVRWLQCNFYMVKK